ALPTAGTLYTFTTGDAGGRPLVVGYADFGGGRGVGQLTRGPPRLGAAGAGSGASTGPAGGGPRRGAVRGSPRAGELSGRRDRRRWRRSATPLSEGLPNSLIRRSWRRCARPDWRRATSTP